MKAKKFDIDKFQEYVATYTERYEIENIMYLDMLYGIGISVDKEKYSGAGGFQRFKKDVSEDHRANLFNALDSGHILYNENKRGEREFIFKSTSGYERKGWGSALGQTKDVIYDIVEHSGEWRIFPDFNMNTDEYPFPWSTKWEDKK